ncbi:unnamed protein product [Merluccius merluccius]
MFCRRAWHRLGPLARRAADPAMRNVAPVRHMAYGIPGTNNMAYFVLCGGGLTAAMVYAYKTVNGDSERYDDRLADMDSTKQAAPEAEPAPVAPEPTVEAVAVQAEPAAVEEAVPAVAEEVPAPVETPEELQTEAPAAEVVSETSAEPTLEVIPEEAIPQEAVVEVVLEEPVIVSAEVPEATVEDATDPAVAGEEESVTVETIAEEAPVAVEEEAALAEVPQAESEDLLPDLLTAVTVLASSATVEIAAASVGEKSIVEAVRQMEENRLALQVLEPLMEVLAARKEEVDADGEASPDVGMPVNATANSGDAETPSAESPGEAPAHSVGEREAMAPTVEEAAVAESEVPLENPATEEAAPAEKESEPEETANTEDAAAEEAPVNVECTQVEEGTLAEGSAVSEAEAPKVVEADEMGSVPEEAAPITETGHLAAAAAADSDGADVEIVPAIEPQSTSEAPVNDAEHCSSCHASDNAEEGVAPPAELKAEVQTEVQGAIDGSMVSPVEGPLAERMTVVTAES